MSLGTSGQEPSKIKPEYAPEESFLGDALSERDRDRIRMKAPSFWPGLRYPLASGPEGLTLQGRKMAMASINDAALIRRVEAFER